MAVRAGTVPSGGGEGRDRFLIKFGRRTHARCCKEGEGGRVNARLRNFDHRSRDICVCELIPPTYA